MKSTVANPLIYCRYHQPMLGLVFPDVDVAEACVGKMCPNLFGRIGMHPLDHAFPFGIHRARAVRLIDDDELTAWFLALLKNLLNNPIILSFKKAG